MFKIFLTKKLRNQKFLLLPRILEFVKYVFICKLHNHLQTSLQIYSALFTAYKVFYCLPHLLAPANNFIMGKTDYKVKLTEGLVEYMMFYCLQRTH